MLESGIKVFEYFFSGIEMFESLSLSGLEMFELSLRVGGGSGGAMVLGKLTVRGVLQF